MNIRPYVLHQAGPISGLAGTFAGGQTVYVDLDTMEIVSQSPILQLPMDAPPTVVHVAVIKATASVKAATKESEAA